MKLTQEFDDSATSKNSIDNFQSIMANIRPNLGLKN